MCVCMVRVCYIHVNNVILNYLRMHGRDYTAAADTDRAFWHPVHAGRQSVS